MSVVAAGAPRASQRSAALQAVVLFALAAVAWHRTFAELWTTWLTNDNYSHGPLVPLTSLALVWLRRDKLRALSVQPEARGLLLVALGCAMQMLGVRSDVFALQCWGVIPLVFGLSLTFLGIAITRMLAFPIAYLGFMLTFPPVVMNQMSYALKGVAVRLAMWGAHLAGAHVRRSGMSLFVHTGELRVENACSGLRSLIALLATGTVFAYFQPGAGWRRWAFLIAAVPIALLGNSARLVLLIIAADRKGVEWATGAFHDVTGYVLYAVALGLLLLTRTLLLPRARATARGGA